MSKPSASTTVEASARDKEGELHCVRCHDVFDANDKRSKCIVEHDTETFEGSRNGTEWYTGTLGCCGASYRFHRHYSEERADPKYCFEGDHTTEPSDVRYNNCTVKICTKEGCGPDLHDATKKEYGNQQEAKKRARTAKKASREKEKASMRARIEELKKEGRKREARRLRAAMLGMDPDDPELNSDVDPDGCEEFDYASDSSLVPPWAGSDDGSY
mmetsp:Transcript_16848/g.33617  ORF Transcript_16848/g.33617 Transcript_16848/m.33617 type:complete len:215 (-) Transcript_16848:216-860(-)